eukprot:CAMPEP_0171322722 /NCGR_PEP_ID=MMETSP0816-20121228/115132_1 /TAXON_ID=420281 /ORGANISM="Proboscia inermis, Strain CCAP1064/1" /LENGTH=290 /DNA_ID=CAMNT_0011821267 /DNA_START=56 /DNA_END=929 /DNA_ORIENTATION=+
MKTAAVLTLLIGYTSAFTSVRNTKSTTALSATLDLPGALDPVGFFDPLGFAEKANDATLLRYREAEITHGRVAMLATIGFLVGEKVEGSSFLFDAQISGPAITHLSQSLSATLDLPGALDPVGFFDPLGFAEKANDATLLRYREAEITHGRVAMLATIGFLVGEKVEGSSFLFDAQISGPAITHLSQVPNGFWIILVTAIGAAEEFRSRTAFVEPGNVPVDQPGLMRDNYYPGDVGFDPLGIKPEDPEEFEIMVTKELQHGRLAMLAASGFLAQELTDGKGIIEHLTSSS